MEGQTEYTGVFCYSYYDANDSLIGPLKETVSLKAGSLEDAIFKLCEAQSKFVNSKNNNDGLYHTTAGIELSLGQDLVYKDSWRRFTVHCVEEVFDVFDDFDHYNPLVPQSVYAADASIASENVTKNMQGKVDEFRKTGGYTSGTYVVRTDKVLDGVGRTVLKNYLRESG